MRGVTLDPSTVGDTYWVGTAGIPTANMTAIVEAEVYTQTLDLYHGSLSDGTTNWHWRSTATQLRLGRTANTAINLWSDSFVGRVIYETRGQANTTATRTARYKRCRGGELEGPWSAQVSGSHNGLTVSEFVIGRATAGSTTGLDTVALTFYRYVLYNVQLTNAEIDAVVNTPRDRLPAVTRGLVYWDPCMGGPERFGVNHYPRGGMASLTRTGTNFFAGPDRAIRKRTNWVWVPVGAAASFSPPPFSATHRSVRASAIYRM